MAGIAKSGATVIGAGHTLYTADTSVSSLVLLIREIRQTIVATLPEIVEIPETIDVFITDPTTGQFITPIIVMIGKTPRRGDSAVGEDLQILPFDFVYIASSVVVDIVDMQEYVRDRLVLLKRALLLNYRQNGYCNDTRLVEDPIDHENQYKKLFASQSQGLTALVLTVEFDVIEPWPTS